MRIFLLVFCFVFQMNLLHAGVKDTGKKAISGTSKQVSKTSGDVGNFFSKLFKRKINGEKCSKLDNGEKFESLEAFRGCLSRKYNLKRKHKDFLSKKRRRKFEEGKFKLDEAKDSRHQILERKIGHTEDSVVNWDNDYAKGKDDICYEYIIKEKNKKDKDGKTKSYKQCFPIDGSCEGNLNLHNLKGDSCEYLESMAGISGKKDQKPADKENDKELSEVAEPCAEKDQIKLVRKKLFFYKKRFKINTCNKCSKGFIKKEEKITKDYLKEKRSKKTSEKQLNRMLASAEAQKVDTVSTCVKPGSGIKVSNDSGSTKTDTQDKVTKEDKAKRVVKLTSLEPSNTAYLVTGNDSKPQVDNYSRLRLNTPVANQFSSAPIEYTSSNYYSPAGSARIVQNAPMVSYQAPVEPQVMYMMGGVQPQSVPVATNPNQIVLTNGAGSLVQSNPPTVSIPSVGQGISVIKGSDGQDYISLSSLEAYLSQRTQASSTHQVAQVSNLPAIQSYAQSEQTIIKIRDECAHEAGMGLIPITNQSGQIISYMQTNQEQTSCSQVRSDNFANYIQPSYYTDLSVADRGQYNQGVCDQVRMFDSNFTKGFVEVAPGTGGYYTEYWVDLNGNSESPDSSVKAIACSGDDSNNSNGVDPDMIAQIQAQCIVSAKPSRCLSMDDINYPIKNLISDLKSSEEDMVCGMAFEGEDALGKDELEIMQRKCVEEYNKSGGLLKKNIQILDGEHRAVTAKGAISHYILPANDYLNDHTIACATPDISTRSVASETKGSVTFESRNIEEIKSWLSSSKEKGFSIIEFKSSDKKLEEIPKLCREVSINCPGAIGDDPSKVVFEYKNSKVEAVKVEEKELVVSCLTLLGKSGDEIHMPYKVENTKSGESEEVDLDCARKVMGSYLYEKHKDSMFKK